MGNSVYGRYCLVPAACIHAPVGTAGGSGFGSMGLAVFDIHPFFLSAPVAVTPVLFVGHAEQFSLLRCLLRLCCIYEAGGCGRLAEAVR